MAAKKNPETNPEKFGFPSQKKLIEQVFLEEQKRSFKLPASWQNFHFGPEFVSLKQLSLTFQSENSGNFNAKDSISILTLFILRTAFAIHKRKSCPALGFNCLCQAELSNLGTVMATVMALATVCLGARYMYMSTDAATRRTLFLNST